MDLSPTQVNKSLEINFISQQINEDILDDWSTFYKTAMENFLKIEVFFFLETLMDLSLNIVSFLHFSLLFFDHLNNDTIHNALFTKSYEFQQENKQTG